MVMYSTYFDSSKLSDVWVEHIAILCTSRPAKGLDAASDLCVEKAQTQSNAETQCFCSTSMPLYSNVMKCIA